MTNKALVARSPLPRAQGIWKPKRAAQVPAKAAKPARSIKAPVGEKLAAEVGPTVPAKIPATGRAQPVSAHPGYARMVHETLKHLQDRKGSSRQAILKYIMANYAVGHDQRPVNNHLKKALVSGTKNGILKNVGQGKGASGLFKLPEKLTQAAAAPRARGPARKRAADPHAAAAPQAKKAKVTQVPSARTSPAPSAKKNAKAAKVTSPQSQTTATHRLQVEVDQVQPQASLAQQVTPKQRLGERPKTQTKPNAPAPSVPSTKAVNARTQDAPSTPTRAAPALPRKSRAKSAVPAPQPQSARAKHTTRQLKKVVVVGPSAQASPVPKKSRAKVVPAQPQSQGQRTQARRSTQEPPMPAPQTVRQPQSTGLNGRPAVHSTAIQSPAIKDIRRSRWGQGPAEANPNPENQIPVFGPAPKPADYVEQLETNQPGPEYGPMPRPAGYVDIA